MAVHEGASPEVTIFVDEDSSHDGLLGPNRAKRGNQFGAYAIDDGSYTIRRRGP